VNLDEQREHIRSAHGVKRKTKNERTCVRCEETFISASKNAKYCSPLCRKKAELARAEAEDRYCPGCGDLLVNKPDQVHCCRRCLGIALHDVPQPGTDAVA
jgi:hypothetical protein